MRFANVNTSLTNVQQNETCIDTCVNKVYVKIYVIHVDYNYSDNQRWSIYDLPLL